MEKKIAQYINGTSILFNKSSIKVQEKKHTNSLRVTIPNGE